MIKRTFNLNDLFTLDTGFYGWCLDTIGEIIPNVLTTTSLQDNFRNYMLKPLWRKYQYVNANYDDSDSGRQQFQNDFANQLQDICVEFYTYVKANVKHFEGLDNKTDLIKQVSSVVAPINDIIDQTATDTALAKGTTAQNIGTTLYNDSVWLSMFNTYMTPQRKGEMLNRFAWLFLIAYYTGEKEQEEEYVLEVTDTLNMRNGDQVIEFEVDEEITEVVVTIEKPKTMIPRNIVNGVNIGGVVGTHECEVVEPVIEELTITENGTYNAPSGVDGYNPVNVNVEGLVPTGTLGITANGEYDVTEYANVNVEVESGGSAEFNIAYGDTEPSDTSKLWVKTSEPNKVEVTTRPVYVVDELQYNIANLPTAASDIASAVVGTKVYLFGGRSGSILSTINVFDTENNTISTLDATLPTGVYDIASAVVGTKVYLFGGRGSSRVSTINVFDTENNTISTLDATLPTATSNITSAVVGTKVYLFGGYDIDGSLSTINVFDTENNTISTLSVTLPTKTYSIASAVVGTKVYLFGGRSGGILSTINVFDTENNTISTLDATLPTETFDIASAVVGTKVYLFGGYDGDGRLSTINVFDTENNTISTLDVTLPTAASNITSAVVGTKVYLFGGYDGGYDGGYLSTINVFVLALSLPTNNMLLEATLVENTFNLLPNVEIGVKNVYIGNADGRGELVNAALYKNGAWTDI